MANAGSVFIDFIARSDQYDEATQRIIDGLQEITREAEQAGRALNGIGTSGFPFGRVPSLDQASFAQVLATGPEAPLFSEQGRAPLPQFEGLDLSPQASDSWIVIENEIGRVLIPLGSSIELPQEPPPFRFDQDADLQLIENFLNSQLAGSLIQQYSILDLQQLFQFSRDLIERLPHFADQLNEEQFRDLQAALPQFDINTLPPDFLDREGISAILSEGEVTNDLLSDLIAINQGTQARLLFELNARLVEIEQTQREHFDSEEERDADTRALLISTQRQLERDFSLEVSRRRFGRPQGVPDFLNPTPEDYEQELQDQGEDRSSLSDQFRPFRAGLRESTVSLNSFGFSLDGLTSSIEQLISVISQISSVSNQGSGFFDIFNAGIGIFNNLLSFGTPPVEGSADHGGPGRAGRAYLIGTGAQPELFVPDTDGMFFPNVAGSNGGQVNNTYVLDPRIGDPREQQRFFIAAIQANNEAQRRERLRDSRRISSESRGER